MRGGFRFPQKKNGVAVERLIRTKTEPGNLKKSSMLRGLVRGVTGIPLLTHAVPLIPL